MVTSKVNSEIRHMIVDAVERQLNPILRKLKQKMVSTGSTQYEIEWAVRDNRLLVGIKPKNWKEGITYPNTNDSTMLCLKGMMPALIRDSQNRVERAAATNGTDFTCVAPKFDCEQTSCSVCADVDLVVSSGSTDMQLCDIRREDNVGEALTLTISPKIWNLLDRNAHIINRAVTSIKIPDIGGLVWIVFNFTFKILRGRREDSRRG
ncbi:hypothetical protein Y032_0248g81 [Ancylostoma ceylanicum]|uniref:Uncharacterized protein n=1 Tax=Ancylostoma ceylanicum TaxID=53326 RepID=A0A016SDD8_9BILA|nr:hypothetical protein Y032_0248g81 [Ancylostoma ceylanicum]